MLLSTGKATLPSAPLQINSAVSSFFLEHSKLIIATV
jgi:hypothetical protein